jgi:SAM-dependent methyltransferase
VTLGGASESEDVGALGVPSPRHRAYVGPAEAYDLMAAAQFNLLTALGLREKHRLLDVGCGSLRAGRLLIPYLLPDRYCGVEPDRELVEAGIRNELGEDVVKLKRPRFFYGADFRFETFGETFDYAIAQSVFSHAGLAQVELCVQRLAAVTHPESLFVATYFEGERDYAGAAWVYPECVTYRAETMKRIADAAGFASRSLSWPHRHGQTWLLFWRIERTTPLPTIAHEWEPVHVDAENDALRYRVRMVTTERDAVLARLDALREHPYVRFGIAVRRLLSRAG